MGRERRKRTLTPAFVTAVKPAAVPVEWTDAKQDGLLLRVEPTGRKFWWVRYVFEGKGRRFKIGSADLSLKDARRRAHDARAKAEKGIDPHAEKVKAREGETVAGLVDAWLADGKLGPVSKWKGGLEGGSARSFLPHVRRFKRDLGGKKLVEVTAKDVERFVSEPEAHATQNRALTALRGFYAWAKRKGHVEADPSATLDKQKEAERSRTLTDDELRALVRGFDRTRYGRAVRLLALTGLRRDEVLAAEWSWLDANAGLLTIPPEAEKTGRSRGEPRRVALSPAAVALLADQREARLAEGNRRAEDGKDYIFATSTGERPHVDVLKPILYGLRGRRTNGQAPSKDKRAKPRPVLVPADVMILDLRRTVADALLNRLGAAPWVVDHVVLGHARPKLLRTYMPVLPVEEARTALTRWSDELARILGERPAPSREVRA